MTPSNSTPLSFGQWLRRLRSQQDLTQEALAEAAYCSVQTIRFFETGKRRPSLEMAERLAEVLQVPAAQQAEFCRLARLPLEKAADADEEAPAPPPSPATFHKPRLPYAATVLVGREGERNILIRLLHHDQHRLVTLVGAGGMGKTRLALETANVLANHFNDGAAFVTLTSVQTAGQLPQAVAEVLGIDLKGQHDPGQQILTWLATRHLLLVLDNFEHLLEADNQLSALPPTGQESQDAITWLRALLAGAPKVHLLITSRERLRISSERTFELGGLSLPGPTVAPEATEAVKPFVERAHHVSGDFVLDEANKAAIVRICQLVGGMPLGIELAAAWVRVLSCVEIAEEMARSLDFLVRADRDVSPRHHSMRAVFDSSWRLLAPEEQRVAARLAVLRGSFDRAAAQAIAGASLPQLAALVDKSFIRVGGAEAGGARSTQRYDVHELLRQYLFEQLQASGEEQVVKRRHTEFYTRLAERIDPDFHIEHTVHWRRQLAMEQSNLRTALTWSVSEGHDLALGLRLAAALGSFGETICNWKEGRQWLHSALVQTEENQTVRARALVKLGELHHLLAEATLAEQRIKEGLTLWQALADRPSIAYTLLQLGKVASTRGDYEQAKTLLEESLTLYRQLGHHWGIASLLNQLGGIEIHLGNYERASQLLDEAWPLIQTMEQRPTIGVATNLLGRALLGQGQIDRAVTLFQRALQIFQQEESQAGMAWSFINLALTYLQIGELSTAQRYFQDCFRTYRLLESKGGMMAALEGVAAIAARQGEVIKAVQLLAVAAQWRQESGQALTEHELATQQQTRQVTEAALDPATWQATWQSVQHWSVAQVANVTLG